MKKIMILPAILGLAIFLFATTAAKNYKQPIYDLGKTYEAISCDIRSIMPLSSQNSYKEIPKSTFIQSSNGTVDYLYENFDQYYQKYSKEIEQYESLKGLTVSGGTDMDLETLDKYNGDSSLIVNVKSPSTQVAVRKEFTQPIDLSRWTSSGFISMWVKTEESKGLLGIKLRVGNTAGSYREFNELKNLQLGIPNDYGTDDPYIDLKYPLQNNFVDEWTDFWVNKGWNYLPWRMDKDYFKDYGQVNLNQINWVEVVINTDGSFSSNLWLDDLRVQDGLQKEGNSTSGYWYPPLGRPQYGVYDIDSYILDDATLKLLNIRQSQYPSNGDHGRIVSKLLTPLNFEMKVRLQLTNFPVDENFNNTWFRMMYDFDPEYDPGHDWFGAYLSLDWSKFGLVTVIPTERFVLQDSEPKNNGKSEVEKQFSPKEDVLYEIHMLVQGQSANATIYEIKKNCLKPIKSVSYTFNRQRYQDKRYPIAFEVTGNIKAVFHEIEVIKL